MTESERTQPARPPFIRGWQKLWAAIALLIIGSWQGDALKRFLDHAGGWTGAAKLGIASILPLVAMIYLGGMLSQVVGMSREPLLRFLLVKWYVLFGVGGLVFGAPALWQWSGKPELAEHAALGGVVGLVVGLGVRVWLARRHRADFLRGGGERWRWEQRLMLAGFVLLGGIVVVFVG